MFKKYQHIERLGTSSVNGITDGTCYIFPKIDGANCQVFLKDSGELGFGSRNKEITIENSDKQVRGLIHFVNNDDRYVKFLKKHKNFILYGELLVPHQIKHYNETAWNVFYIFDVYDTKNNKYLCYDEYSAILDPYDLNFIPLIEKIENPTEEYLEKLLEKAKFLISDKEKNGEGIVIKNYNFINRFGRTIFAKIISAEFYDQKKTNGFKKKERNKYLEQLIVDEFATESFINKTLLKIDESFNEFHKMNLVLKELIDEESFNFIKKTKFGIIDFKKLRGLVYSKVHKTITNKET